MSAKAVADQGLRTIGVLVKMFPKLSETFVLEEVLGLERLGVPLRLYALAPPSDALSHPAAARVRAAVVQVPQTAWRHGARLLQRHLALLLRSPWRYGRALHAASRRGHAGVGDFLRAGWLAEQLREDGVAHLHTHFISAPADVAELVSLVSGLPFSISAHAKDIYLSEATDLQRKMDRARFTVTCTECNRAALHAIAPDAPVHRMYHGIDASAFHPSRRIAPPAGEPPLLLSIGRLRAKKGLDTLVEACGVLARRGVDFRAEIVGYGEERERLIALIGALGLGARITLTGKLAREQVIERYARAAVYVQPSRIAADGDRDGIPNVLLEAMAMTVPVVATRVSGIPELVQHERNGLLVEPDDPAALAEAIERTIASPAAAAERARIARDRVIANFDNDRNLRLVLRLLDSPMEAADACAMA